MGDSGSRRHRVLVIDDDRDTAESLQIFLTHAGQDVRVAHDGASGIDAARAWQPEVIVLDIGLPDRDGFEVARHLRRALGPASTLVALSGYGNTEDVARSRDAGFDYHLVKPVDADVLSEIITGHGAPRGRVDARRVERLSSPRVMGTR
jgi:two-component system CheB/CheR fusion protein